MGDSGLRDHPIGIRRRWQLANSDRDGESHSRPCLRLLSSSSVWLVCKKRPETARPGWDNRVLDEMRQNIHTRLRDYWDAGIRGPDFVWAATGPAMEAYSKHPVVKKANEPGKLMEVAEFLRAVRRLVVDFVVGRVLTGERRRDHRERPGRRHDLLHPPPPRLRHGRRPRRGLHPLRRLVQPLRHRPHQPPRNPPPHRRAAAAAAEDDEDRRRSEETDADAEPEEGTGSTVKLRPWHQRKRKTMGYDDEGRPAPLIDQVHRLMHLWKLGDVVKVDDYLDARGLRKNALFLQLLQALIELARREGATSGSSWRTSATTWRREAWRRRERLPFRALAMAMTMKTRTNQLAIESRRSTHVIESLQLKRFKNFKDATLTLGPLTILIGANASGKKQYPRCLPLSPWDRPGL